MAYTIEHCWKELLYFEICDYCSGIGGFFLELSNGKHLFSSCTKCNGCGKILKKINYCRRCGSVK